ncbi:thioredoxin H1-like [Chenopodium quinoa]|uniref:thioredoxin H1-like n=1 Tax=Chenopodium quinoa TaxID=63459 RepID=UPI000B795523|nr:thioredoxin H1-like [Chenopodium quinoa]
MYSFRENRRPVRTAVASPVSFSAADNNRHSANHWSNNFGELRKTPDHYAPYAAVPATHYNLSSNNSFAQSSFPATNNSSVAAGSGSGSGSALHSIATTSKEIISFHSSTKWKEYLQDSKQSNKLVVVYFTAKWCGPCRSMEPTIKEFAAKYNNVELVKIDVDELFNVSCEYEIQTMPTFLFMKNEKQIDKVAGAKTEDLQRKIEKHRAN